MKKAFFIGATVLFIGGAFAFNVNNSMNTAASGCGICGAGQCTQPSANCCGSGTCCTMPGCCK